MKKIIGIILCVVMGLSVGGCGVNAPTERAENLEGLRGKVVLNIGQGNPPDLTFRYILKEKGIEYVFSDEAVSGKVALSYVASADMIAGKLTAGKASYAIAGEPSATLISEKIGASIFLDIQSLYNAAAGTNIGYPQACLVVKSAFLAAHPRYVADLVAKITDAKDWNAQNPSEALAALKTQGSTLAALTSAIAKRCNIGFIEASTNIAALEKYYTEVRGVVDTENGETNPIEKLPTSDFYKAAPSSGEAESGVKAKISAPDGAPALALAKAINDGFEATYNIVAPNLIGAQVKDSDILILPSLAAANLFNKGQKINMLGIVTMGNLYMLEKTAK